MERDVGFGTGTLLGLVGSLQRRCLTYRTEDTREGASSAEGTPGSICRAGKTELLCRDIADCLEACCSRGSDLVETLSDERLGAVEADDVCESSDRIKELVEIDRTRESDVTEVTRAVLVGLLAGRALLSILNNAEAGVKDTVGDGLTALVGLVGGDLNNRTLEDVVRVGESELNANDSVTHV